MPRSQAERLWMIGGGIVGFVMVLIGYFFFISPQRTQTSDVDSQVASAHAANDQLQVRLDKLREQNKNLATFQAQAAQSRLALPDASGLSAFLRTLQQIGGATRTDVTSLVAGNPVSVSAAVAAPAAASPASNTGPGAVNAANNAAASANAAAAGSGTTQTAPSAGGARIYAIPITMTVAGSPASLNQFLVQLQSVQPRAVLVSQLTETAPATNHGAKIASDVTTLNLTMYAFVSPASASETAQLQAVAGK